MRRSFTLCSIVVHAVAIAAVFFAQVLADSTLPTPHQPLIFDAPQITLVEIKPPAPPRRVERAPAEAAPVSENAAPLVAPTGVSAETGRENLAAPSTGSIHGTENGVPLALEGVSTASVPPAPPPPPPVPVRLHSGMKAPVKIVNVAPVYPAIARAAQIQGMVILEAILDAQGRVATVRVLRSIPALDQAAVDAVQQWRFTPAMLNNEVVPVVMTVTVNFTLER